MSGRGWAVYGDSGAVPPWGAVKPVGDGASASARAAGLRLAVNGKPFATPVKGGAVRTATNLVGALATRFPALRVDVYVPAATDAADFSAPWPDNVDVRVERARRYGHGGGRSLWEQLQLPLRCRRADHDLLLNLTNSCPVLLDPGIPQLLLVHDAGWANTRWYSTAYARYLRWLLGRAVGRGVHFVTVSQTSARQLKEAVPGLEAIEVIRTDGDVPPESIPDPGVDRPYALFLGSLNPRKNPEGAVRAFRLFARRSEEPAELRIVGGRKDLFRDSPVLSEGPSVTLEGYVSDLRRWSLLRGARLLLLPSFLEGVGLPVLEAMRVDTPSVVSDIPVFHELFGDAVAYVDPASEEDMARGIGRVFGDQAYRKALLERGRDVRGRFSWERTANRVLELALRTVEGP